MCLSEMVTEVVDKLQINLMDKQSHNVSFE